ncbi:succinate dehydrogenase/fumarate reductase flavoprotein subunit [Thermococci archaeon]|nr:MAG: succinate dehydrogenase/fumarate reductase flavoprotein subunit [Thermococci archaeon]
MSYPEEMRKSIEKVEETRDERLGLEINRMSLEEREEILKKFHPDYRPEAKREIGIGPNKGDLAPNEVVDLLESYPIVDPEEVDLSQVDYDVSLLIIGGGGAGTVAALWAHYSGLPVEEILISTKLRHGDSNSIMAQGGIQAADKPDDSPVLHYLDVMGGGHFANKPELVRELVLNAPSILKWHEDLGVMYDKDEDGNMLTLPGGGTCRNRLHSAKDYTGMEIMRVIRDEARNLGIEVLEFSPAVELLTDNGRVTGALLWNMETNQYYVIRAKAVILATGGFGRLHIQGYPTTNHYGATADGLVMAYRVGARLRDMDSVQYHPTGAAYPEQIVGLLVTEKVRGLGAQPVNREGEAFVHPLEPRDVEAAAIIRECYERRLGIETPTGMVGVWLDTPMIEEIHGKGTIESKLSAMYRMYSRFGIDMTQDPILVFPTLHYQNGGVEIDEKARVLGESGVIDGLFAAGEVTGGVHGKNRLMGNSLLDYNVFGKIAGESAAKYCKSNGKGRLTLDHVIRYMEALKKMGVPENRKSPLILPDYRGKKVLMRTLDLF